MIDSPITDKIDESKFIGWPIFNRIGGYYADNILDKLDEINHEIQMNLTEETSEYTPITDLFDSMDFTFKESVNRQIYALFFTHAIHKINKDLEIKEKL